jgi:hypothetical protein
MSSFSKAVVLVTGGANGIGLLMGKKALKKNASELIIWDINANAINAAVQDLSSLGYSVHGQVVDISSAEQVSKAAGQVISKFGGVDILINNAGIVVGKMFQEHSFADIDRTVGVNQLGHMYVTRAFLKSMMERRKGHIVSVTSAAGLTPTAGMVAYSASKWGAMGWIESLRVELATTAPALKVLNVIPSYIKSEMFKGVKPPFLMPLLEPEWITDKIIAGIENDKKQIIEPTFVKFTNFFRGVLPKPLYDFTARILNVYSAMNTFEGRKNE